MTLARVLFLVLLLAAPLAHAQGQPVLVLQFPIGSATLTSSQEAQLDDLLRQYPPDRWRYWFEGDHNDIPYRNLSGPVSQRLSERLAESRWQAIARRLGVPAVGLVRWTGKTEARVFVEPQSAPAAPGAFADSLGRLRADLDANRQATDQLRRDLDEVKRTGMGKAAAEPETTFAVGRVEVLRVRLDKWAEERWWESGAGIEIGLLRVQPDRPNRHTGAALIVSDGTFAYQPFEISTRFDFIRLGVPRIGITPSLRWFDWSLRVHYGDDFLANVSWFSNSDPVYLIGLDLDANPWRGNNLTLKWAGLGTRVHADDREFISHDWFDFNMDQGLGGGWGLSGQAVYDERFEKALCYSGLWVGHGWPMRIGEFSLQLGYVLQLDALAATTGKRREDFKHCVSLGVEWHRKPRFR